MTLLWYHNGGIMGAARPRPLRGSFWVLVLYDVAEQIQLDNLSRLLKHTDLATRSRNFPEPDSSPET